MVSRDYKDLFALAAEVPLRRKLVICTEPRRRTADDGVEVMPVDEFLSDLWQGRIL